MSFKVEVGGGGHLIQASGVKTEEPLKLTLDYSRSLSNGAELVQRVLRELDGAKRGETSAIRELAALIAEFPDLTWAIPEFREYFVWLLREGRQPVIARLLDESLRRGRPREDHAFQICAFMKAIMEDERRRTQRPCSQHRAAELLREKYAGKLHPFKDGTPGVKRLENLYGEARERYRLALEGYFVPGERLATDRRPIVPAELRRRR